MLGYDKHPPELRRYLLVVSVLGPALAFGLASAGGWPSGRELFPALMLAVLAAAAERHPLHLTHKTSITVSSAAHVAMVLMLPTPLPALLAFLAVVAADGLRRRAGGEIDLSEFMFNAAQVALHVAAGAVCFAALRAHPLGPQLDPFGSLGALVVASAAMHVVNTGLVSGAAGLQLGVSPLRVWWHNLALDLTPHVTLTVLGTVGALLAGDRPLLLPFLAVPAVLIHRATQQTTRLRTDTHEALASLVEVVELRDPYTAGHSRRVAATARRIARRLGLTEEEADVIESTGRVHDIGKVAIDPLVLTKPGKLSDEEWAQLKLHPVHGANVVERFVAYRDGVPVVRHHHERWDGGGYPDGLAGEAIPLGARILAVADAFDAMTSDRPYRDGLSIERAVEILRDGAGSQWDPTVVEGFLALLAATPGEVPVFERRATTGTVAARLDGPDAPLGGGRPPYRPELRTDRPLRERRGPASVLVRLIPR